MADRLPPPQRNSRQNNGSEKIVKAKSKKGLTKDDLFITGSIDVPFFAVTMALLTIGLVMLFSGIKFSPLPCAIPAAFALPIA